ncbi:NADPH-dependent 2,4-dienoyl-CoA reductase, sulfur reductase [Alkalithermobacter thermoalcaliphilus JW-YL-7 = DSM 7308]|uniref:CoA-disulfide reductase n=1 Tax=Alkalithermobacter thermoalcaliphilus JW-YL-7 = DSM 7308 TaxID=1121328 RepID=A0A150FPE9_CLOPD|nr:CoA-disulfide reductase [[Clostridium] paradoxum JW-YL-7 = DSM 7308]SHK49425.1 NADPH-dependent 2,4-dienoyl-CoA reductase, sulfur reductase [[Clostridium] paradoxum JW-YL-7 = DSM 7308]
MKKKVLIIGGVAGGASAAARLRRLDEDIEIIMFERGGYISFANCGLPYYIGGTINERQKLLVQTEEGMEKRFNIDVRTHSEVTNIFTDTKEVEVVSNGKTYKEKYDYLILSPGAAPFVPSIEGVSLDQIYTLRNMEDVDRIKEHVTKNKINKAVVIGGGYVGIEMAENLKHIGIDTTLVEAAEQVMGPLDFEMAKMIEKHMIDNGIKLIVGDAVEKFEKGNTLELTLKSGKKLNTDIVIMAIGVRPEINLAKKAGLEIGERGGIKVDSNMKTSDPYIYAVGDAIEVEDFINGVNTLIPLAGPANKQGRIAADNICGRESVYKGTQGTSIIKVFDLTAASTGNNEKTLKTQGIPYVKSYTQSGSHAGYYPGAFQMTIKLLFSPEDGKILGAQIVGRDGVDKRIDVIATAIRAGMTVYDLEELELAYAPPYSSAKDPVNIAGFTAANILKGDMKIIHVDELKGINKDEYFIIDVRTDVEFEAGHLEGAVNIPVDELRKSINKIPKDKKIIVYCKVGLRGYIAYRILTQKTYDVYNLSGGYDLVLAYNMKYGEGLKLNDEMTKLESIEEKKEVTLSKKTIKVDACGLQCPGPIMRVKNEIEKVNEGDVLEIHVTDSGFATDIKAWCERTGNTLIGTEKTCCDYIAYVMKGKKEKDNTQVNVELPQGKTMVVFSGDLDKAIASFIIANGAAAMGRPVTMFFTFWGLNVLRKDTSAKVSKTFIEKMFAKMMPRGSKKLALSKLNMGGIGPKMIRGIMKKKNIASLEELIEQAKVNGVKIVACSMSMDVMGIKKEELIEGVEIGGVAAYLGEAEKSNVNLFI